MGTINLIESFDLYGDSELAVRWLMQLGGTDVNNTINVLYGRTNKGLRLLNRVMRRDGLGMQTILAVGFGLKKGVGWPISEEGIVIGCSDNSTSGVNQCSIRITHDQIRAYRDHYAAGGALLDTVSFNFLAENWYYVEVEMQVDDTTGYIKVWIDDALVLNVTGVDTQQTANAWADQIFIQDRGDSGGSYWDDGYVAYGSGARQGPGSVLVPDLDGDGVSNDWTPSAAVDHYTLVDERPPDAADYVESATATDKELYTIAPLGVTVDSVRAVQISTYAQETGVTARQLRTICRPGSTNNFGDTKDLLASLQYDEQVHATNPDTASPWSLSEVEGSEYGFELVS